MLAEILYPSYLEIIFHYTLRFAEIIMALKKDVTKILTDHLPSVSVSELEPITEQLFKDFRFLNRKNPRIQLVSREDLKEVEPWVELNFMLRVMGKERWMVTDMSALSDFRPENNIDDAMAIGSKPGTYIFERRWIKDDGEEKVDRWEAEPDRFHENLIHRCLEVFGVNPKPWVWRESLPTIFSSIFKEITEEKKAECVEFYENDIA